MLKSFVVLPEISAALALPNAKSRAAAVTPRMVFIKPPSLSRQSQVRLKNVLVPMQYDEWRAEANFCGRNIATKHCVSVAVRRIIRLGESGGQCHSEMVEEAAIPALAH
jgi:hypothetical protein